MDKRLRIVIMGVSGSGKSTIGALLAHELALPFIEGDALHPEENIAKMRAGHPLQDEDRWPWLDRIAELIALSDKGVVVSCSALKKAYRDRLRQKSGGQLRFIFLDAASTDLLMRMRERSGHFMPVSLLESQIATLEAPAGEALLLAVDASASPQAIVNASLDWLGV